MRLLVHAVRPGLSLIGRASGGVSADRQVLWKGCRSRPVPRQNRGLGAARRRRTNLQILPDCEKRLYLFAGFDDYPKANNGHRTGQTLVSNPRTQWHKCPLMENGVRCVAERSERQPVTRRTSA